MRRNKKSKASLSNADFEQLGVIGAEKAVGHFDACEFAAGRETKEPVYKTRGCPINFEGVLVQTYATDPYRLYLRSSDGDWFLLDRLLVSTPVIKDLQEKEGYVEVGPSEAEIAKAEKAEKERQEYLDSIEAARIRNVERIKEEQRKSAKQHKRLNEALIH